MATKFKIDSDMSEKQIESDVASYFGFCSSVFGQFRLLDVNEQITGADKQFDWAGVAYFLQFKKPTGLMPLNATLKASPKQPLQKIRAFRQSNALDQHPYSLCFELRKQPNAGVPLQHNVLYAYEAPPKSRAMYVCPTKVGSNDYMQMMQMSVNFPFAQWHIQQIVQQASTGSGSLISARLAETVPFLRGHASIVPHAQVTTSNHHYSFSTQATDIAFHEPQLLHPGPNRLSDFVATEIRSAAANIERLSSPSALARSLALVARATWAADILPEPTDEGSFDWLALHGRELHERFGIRQMIGLYRLPRR